MSARRDALRALDRLSDREFAAVTTAVKPAGITRETYRTLLWNGTFSSDAFLRNVAVVRWALSDEPPERLAAWIGQRSEPR